GRPHRAHRPSRIFTGGTYGLHVDAPCSDTQAGPAPHSHEEERAMKRRTVFGLVTAGALGLAAAGGAAAHGAHAGGRHAFMKRMVAAAIDDALDEAKVTPEQRTAIAQIRDRAFAAVEEARASRRAHLEEGLRLFEADQIDPAQAEAFERQAD